MFFPKTPAISIHTFSPHRRAYSKGHLRASVFVLKPAVLTVPSGPRSPLRRPRPRSWTPVCSLGWKVVTAKKRATLPCGASDDITSSELEIWLLVWPKGVTCPLRIPPAPARVGTRRAAQSAPWPPG